MPCERPSEKAVFEFWACTNIVNNPWTLAPVRCGHDDANVRKFPRDHAGNEITGCVVGGILCDWETLAVASEERLEIRDTSVVDVRVWPSQPPVLWVAAEVFLHVLMHELLKVDTKCSIAANDLIRAYTSVGWHITTWVADADVSRVIDHSDFGAVQSRRDEPRSERGGRRCDLIGAAEAEDAKE